MTKKTESQTSVLKTPPKTQYYNGKVSKRGFCAMGVANGLNKVIRCVQDYITAHQMGKCYHTKEAIEGLITMLEGTIVWVNAYEAIAKSDNNDLDELTSKSKMTATGYIPMLQELLKDF